ncbi:phage tail tape measure protein [Bosea sp. (in: a-proteobacteria)]|uniref:phage tail tape measure protein n=1 Tax=Bosea sp. (in: a-proteobacteria) TaxID=1871050 RepID=UPI003B3A85E1
MAVVNEARAILTAEDRASQVLAMVARNFDRLNGAANRMDRVIGNPRAAQEIERRTSRLTQITTGMGMAARSAMGPVAGLLSVYGAGQALSNANKVFAQNERAMTRIAITADASSEAQQDAWRRVQDLARETAQPVADVREGLDALVSAGRTLPDAMDFLPSVARTAQASGSAVADIARTAESVGSSFKIAGADMQTAFDIMAAGGKAGQFELKDMARYLPSLGPAASAIGFSGKKGLSDLVAMLQILRKGSGTAEEAVASMNNILAKMESDKTTKSFKALGVDSEAAFKKARAEGKNLIEVFEQLVDKALKGDRSRLGEIIDDMEFKRGVQALMMYRGEWQKLSQTMQSSSAGTVAQDLARVTGNSQASFDRFRSSADRLADTLGRRVAPAFKAIAEAATSATDAMNEALKPGETDEERLARLAKGGDVPQTRAEKSIEAARRAQERQKQLDDPNSEIYSMRDGGFAANPGRYTPRAPRDNRNRPASQRVPMHLAMLEEVRRDREQYAEEQRLADYRERQANRARFLAEERRQNAIDNAGGPRAGDEYRDVDALTRKRERVRVDTDQSTADEMFVNSGEASRDVMAGVMTLAQLIRAQRLTADGESNVFGLGGAEARATAIASIATALRAIAERQAGDGGSVDETKLKTALEAITGLAERIGGAVPTTGPKGRVEGIYSGVEEILKGGVKAEVKPDQITAKSEVSVNGDVQVRIAPSPEFMATIERKVMSFRGSDARGISLPGKEMPSGGGGGGGGAQ